MLQFSPMAISEFPPDELETVFKGRAHLDALWKKIAQGETEFSPKEQIQLILTEARLYDLRGDSARTMELAERAEQLARRYDDAGSVGTAIALRGYVLQRFGEYESARQLHREALPLLENSPEIVHPLRGLAVSCFMLNDWTSAEMYYDRAIKTSRALGYAVGLCTSLLDASELYYAQGRFEVALSALDESARLMERVGISVHRGFYFVHRGVIFCLMGKRTEARHALHGLSEFTNASLLESYYRLLGGWLALLEEDLALAEKELLRARVLAETHGDIGLIGYVRLLYGWLYRARGEFGRALNGQAQLGVCPFSLPVIKRLQA